MQARQADLEAEPGVKAELWRAIARRWLDQFSNVQNAVEAYEKLHAVEPEGSRSDRSPQGALRQAARVQAALRSALAGGRGVRPRAPSAASSGWRWPSSPPSASISSAQAVALYKRVLDEEPSSSAALDALEKHAERDKDFATVAEVLERRTELAPDAAARLAILLKLGGIYSDRVRDPAKAMSAWRRVLALQPGHAKALRVLRDSYVAIGDYDGLSELYAENKRLGGARRGALGRGRQGHRRRPQGRPELPLRRRCTPSG